MLLKDRKKSCIRLSSNLVREKKITFKEIVRHVATSKQVPALSSPGQLEVSQEFQDEHAQGEDVCVFTKLALKQFWCKVLGVTFNSVCYITLLVFTIRYRFLGFFNHRKVYRLFKHKKTKAFFTPVLWGNN